MTSSTLATATLRLALIIGHPALADKLGDVQSWSPTVLGRSQRPSTIDELTRQFTTILSRLADEIDVIQSSQYADLGESEIARAVHEIAGAINNIGPRLISLPEFAVEDGITPTEIVIRFEKQMRDRRKLKYSQENLAFRSACMSVCAYALFNWIRFMPRSEAGWTAFVDTYDLLTQTRTMLNEARRASVSGLSYTRRVLANQRNDLIASMGRIELIGLPLEQHLRWVPLKDSYLAGRAASQNAASTPFEELLRASFQRDTAGLRLVIQGKAGSGKTTAAQWIAWSAALRLEPVPTSGNIVPFFVRLRDAAQEPELLSDKHLLYTPHLRDQVSDRWMDECSPRIRPLLIIDGWDEVSELSRPAIHEWLSELLKRYPDSHVVMTTRPEGFAETQFPYLAFRVIKMLPLQADEAVELAERWFAGIAANVRASSTVEFDRLDARRAELIRDLKTPTISDLADSPLVTAMLCSLYSDGHSIAPKRRGQLYEMVSSALLLRDDEKNIGDLVEPAALQDLDEMISPTRIAWSELPLNEKSELVGAVARAMAAVATYIASIGDSKSAQWTKSSTTHPTVLEAIEEALPSIGYKNVDVEAIALQMVSRSLVVQRVGVGRAEFLHRSFQDYFAAAAFRRNSAIDQLLKTARSGQLALLPFACHQATRRVADQIVRWLLAEVSKEESGARRRRELLFSVVECLAASTAVDPDLRQAAESAIEGIVPPQNDDESKALATLGDAAVPFLAQRRFEAADAYIRARCIDTLGRVRSVAAINELARYAEAATNINDMMALSDAWRRIEPFLFVTQVLSQIRGEARIRVSDERRLEACSLLSEPVILTVDGVRFENESSIAVASIQRLRSLVLSRCRDVGNLAWSSASLELRWLALRHCKGSMALEGLGPEELQGLEIVGLSVDHVAWEELLGRLKALRILRVSSDHPGVIPSQALGFTENLRTLALDSISVDSLEFLRHNRKLMVLRAGWPLRESDMTAIQSCGNLRRLAVNLVGEPQYSLDIRRLTELQVLDVTGAFPKLLDALSDHPNLERLVLRDSDIGPLERIRLPRKVTQLVIKRCSTRDVAASAAGDLSRVKHFESIASEVMDLEFVRQMKALQTFRFEDEGHLRSIRGIAHVPRGCRVQLSGTRSMLDDSVVEHLRARGDVEVEFDPTFYLDDGQAVS